MRNIKPLLLYCCCLTCLAWQGCGPDCDADCPEIKTAPQEFLDYWYFPYGSQWVYQLKDSVGIYDTTYTGAYESWVHTKTPECNDGFTPCQTIYKHSIGHSNQDYYPGFGSDTPYEAYRCEYSEHDDSWYLMHSSGTNKLHYFSTFLIFPFNTEQVYNHQSSICSISDSLLSINNTVVPTVTICNPSMTPVGNASFFQRIIFAKGIGMLSVRYDNGEVWELVDYEIAKT